MYQKTSEHLKQSDTIFRNFGLRRQGDIDTYFRQKHIVTYAGYIALGFEQHKVARQQFHTALQLVIHQHSWETMMYVLPGVALLLSDLGQRERAVELYALACRYPFVANSQWFADVVGKHIAKTAESLPPDVVKAVKARGRSRDLWETAEELLAEFGSEAYDVIPNEGVCA